MSRRQYYLLELMPVRANVYYTLLLVTTNAYLELMTVRSNV